MEEWRNIKGYKNYEVSNYGRVRSKDRIVMRNGNKTQLKGKILKGFLRKKYVGVALYNGNRKSYMEFSVHRLVADAFIDNPDNLPCVNHKDENPQNNNADNLEWCTYKYNSNYGTAIERRVKHQNWDIIADKQSKTVIQYDKHGNELARFKSTKDAERRTDFNSSGICRACRGYLKTYKGFVWRYLEDNTT